MKKILLIGSACLLLASCSENYSTCERIGTVTKFSETGLIWKTHEGHLNVTQTGMNSSTGFDFSVDKDHIPDGVVSLLDSAANHGWKIKINTHQTMGWNWFGNRGHTNDFVTAVTVLDKEFDKPFENANENSHGNKGSAGIHDTIYVVINKSK